MKNLILSIFPGIDILSKGFEILGYCVVRGPDRLWGGDIALFHPPPGVFEGVIGGIPCQAFSRLKRLPGARPSKWGNLVPEFVRVIAEAQPDWWCSENIREAPIPQVSGYISSPSLLNNRWCGAEQQRLHRFCFGART